MNEGLIPRRYAKALYKYACEKGVQKPVYDLMAALERSFDDEPQLQQVLSNPFVGDADKMSLLSTAAGVDASGSVYADFLKLLCRNRRIGFAREIALAYLDIYREANGIYVVRVTSAAPLAEAEENRVKNLVLRHLNGGTMEYSSSVDSSLIGGFTVAVGNDRIDASISNELKQLRLNLLSK